MLQCIRKMFLLHLLMITCCWPFIRILKPNIYGCYACPFIDLPSLRVSFFPLNSRRRSNWSLLSRYWSVLIFIVPVLTRIDLYCPFIDLPILRVAFASFNSHRGSNIESSAYSTVFPQFKFIISPQSHWEMKILI